MTKTNIKQLAFQGAFEGTLAALGTAAREDALASVSRTAPEAWVALALDAVKACCQSMEMFTADDVWRKLHEQGVAAPPEPRAMGLIMRRAQTLKLVTPTHTWRLSTRPRCHRRPVRIWTSCESPFTP